MFELEACGGFAKILNRKLREIADIKNFVGLLVAGPGDVRRREQSAVIPNFDGGTLLVDGEDQTGGVASLFDSVAPVVVFVSIEPAEIVVDNVGKFVAPAVAAIVDVQAVANGLIGGALHLDVKSGVDTQAAFVDGFCAVGGFEILANFFEEIRREVIAGILNMQAEGRFLGGGFFG